jgi:hypothetical protein
MRTQKEMLIRNVVLANHEDRAFADNIDKILEAQYLIEECEI